MLLVLMGVALSHYTTKILRWLKENHLAMIASITKGAKIVVFVELICARKAVRMNEHKRQYKDTGNTKVA